MRFRRVSQISGVLYRIWKDGLTACMYLGTYILLLIHSIIYIHM